ncbi:hypothetical protein PF007_g10518 [Phytophthora fragariae]|uniref:Uncharacterized protein n=2 Tax=Phytophthora fragariae TaxID=53985 RepID=A0A6A3SLM3_9STRA|nr:hypothetical protein PF006_g30927 [Phytophthora fragariae]KAE9114094.1 hypothetical protein PF007_g10518 [Phytophthora fragariae]
MVTPSFLLRSNPSVFLAVPSPARESSVSPLMVVFCELRTLKVREGEFLSVKPDSVELVTARRRKKTGRLMDVPCFQYQSPWSSSVPEPLTVKSLPLSSTSGPAHFCVPNVVVPVNSMVAPLLVLVRSSVTPAGTVKDPIVTELQKEMSVPAL